MKGNLSAIRRSWSRKFSIAAPASAAEGIALSGLLAIWFLLRGTAAAQVADTPAPAPPPITKTYAYLFFCTLYYTPRETGFTAERGFDMNPARAPGIEGHPYPKSFLEAVKTEGFGRLAIPVGGNGYLRYQGNGRYVFCRAPAGSRDNRPLVPRHSCAIARSNRRLWRGERLHLSSVTVQQAIGSRDWRVADTGNDLDPWQIDLYWGEDDPLGPSPRDVARPAGTWMEYAFDVIVAAEGDQRVP